LFAQDTPRQAMEQVTGAAGMRMAHANDFAVAALEVDDVLKESDGLFFDDLQVAVCETPPEQMHALAAAAADVQSPVAAVEAERYVYVAQEAQALRAADLQPPLAADYSREYLRGYRDASSHLYEALYARPVTAPSTVSSVASVLWSDTDALTWGLAATRVTQSRYTGKGVSVAILDTGFDFNHPDFQGREIQSKSFVSGETAQDAHGHGTHCTGTACGPASPAGTGQRYGVAGDANIYIGKVLGNSGTGTDGSILAGINWAVQQGCKIVSMSLSSRTNPGEPYSQVYEIAARRALDRGTLLIVAAGNDSLRPAVVRPVGRPANCPSMVAVAAIDAQGQMGYFSNAGVAAGDKQITIAGPGVAITSSWPLPRQYNTISGTSMATPHVAGIAALYLEEQPSLSAADLLQLLKTRCGKLNLSATDIGSGLVQAV
jgi:hypothetical protein